MKKSEKIPEISKGFVNKAVQSPRKFGAKRLVIFCYPCYPIYKHAFPEEEIIFYPKATAEIMGEMEFNKKIDQPDLQENIRTNNQPHISTRMVL